MPSMPPHTRQAPRPPRSGAPPARYGTAAVTVRSRGRPRPFADRAGPVRRATLDVPATEGARRAMHRLLAAVLTSLGAAVLAVGASLGIVAALDATPEQPNVPLVTFDRTP